MEKTLFPAQLFCPGDLISPTTHKPSHAKTGNLFLDAVPSKLFTLPGQQAAWVQLEAPAVPLPRDPQAYSTEDILTPPQT